VRRLFNKIASVIYDELDRLFPPAESAPHGRAVLHDASHNKSTAFTGPERDALGLRGLLPHKVSTQEQQSDRVMQNLRRKTSDIEKYIYLMSLLDRNERLFYYTARHHIREIMPLIYTPTVGQACQEFSHLFQAPKGMYVTPDDKGRIREMLDNWPEDDVRVIVITDGQRILGLGDLGANGMGIPIGKLALYSACGGVDPRQTLPVMFDVGTNNDEIRNDPLYLGYPRKRVTGDEYFALMEEFVQAVRDKFPKAVIQFEDFATDNAYALLDKYRNRTCSFNDDIQGTAAVALAGIYASGRVTGQALEDQRIMFLGAGAAATGIANLLVKALQEKGLTEQQARDKIWLVDQSGLVTSGREKIEAIKQPYAHEHAPMAFLDAIKDIKPTILIGATGSPGTFTQEVVEAMTANNEHPLILGLSNPTSRAECTAKQAYEWSKGRALFISGSPFDPVEYEGRTLAPGQGNNAYIFPGIGLGAVACNASRITEEMFLAAAKAVANMVTDDDLAHGTLYPPLENILSVSARIAEAVIDTACTQGLSGIPRPIDIPAFVAKQIYDPVYPANDNAAPEANRLPAPGGPL